LESCARRNSYNGRSSRPEIPAGTFPEPNPSQQIPATYRRRSSEWTNPFRRCRHRCPRDLGFPATGPFRRSRRKQPLTEVRGFSLENYRRDLQRSDRNLREIGLTSPVRLRMPGRPWRWFTRATNPLPSLAEQHSLVTAPRSHRGASALLRQNTSGESHFDCRHTIARLLPQLKRRSEGFMKTNKKPAPFFILPGAGRHNQVKTLFRKRAKTSFTRCEQSFTANKWMPRTN